MSMGAAASIPDLMLGGDRIIDEFGVERETGFAI
jgi:hypothetical protein